MSRVGNDVDQISDGLIQGFSQLFGGIVTIVGTLVFMLTYNWLIAVIVVVLTPISLLSRTSSQKAATTRSQNKPKNAANFRVLSPK